MKVGCEQLADYDASDYDEETDKKIIVPLIRDCPGRILSIKMAEGNKNQQVPNQKEVWYTDSDDEDKITVQVEEEVGTYL